MTRSAVSSCAARFGSPSRQPEQLHPPVNDLVVQGTRRARLRSLGLAFFNERPFLTRSLEELALLRITGRACHPAGIRSRLRAADPFEADLPLLAEIWLCRPIHG